MILNQLFNEGTNWHTDPEQQSMDATQRGRLEREREPAGSEEIDARIRADNNSRQQYAETGRFWLKQKDSQEHISDAFAGKAAANAAALELLKQQPELRGNIVITAYGPGEQQVTEGKVKELSQDLRDKTMSDEQFRAKYGKTRAEVGAAMRKKPGVAEGYQVVPDIDRERYTERPGLEGPFHTKSGKVVYYDKQEGKYYDPDSDFYISHEDWEAMNEQGVAEGFGDVVKGIKRASQGWGVGAAPDMVTPSGAVSAFKNMDGQRLANFVASRKDQSKPRKNSAGAFVDKVIDREMRQRGYGRVANKDDQGVAEGGYSGIDDTDTVGFSVNSERAYNAVMARFGDQIDHDETSGILYVPARMWPKVEMVAFDADGEGATQTDGLDEGEKVGNMDADRFDAAMARLKQLAGAGPMKTVYDPNKRVYRNVPTAVQPSSKK